jgi:hypothetical protein
MMRFTERIMTAERCMNNISSFTYRKIDEAVMTKTAVTITKQPHSYMLIDNPSSSLGATTSIFECFGLLNI